MKYVVNTEEMRELEQNAIHEIGIPEEVLMERAAYAVYGELLKAAAPEDTILFLCGTGNNGGDGLAAARMAYLKGLRVSVCIVSGEEAQIFKLSSRKPGKNGVPAGADPGAVPGSSLKAAESADPWTNRCCSDQASKDGGTSPDELKRRYLPARCSAGFAGQFSILSKLCEFVGKDRDISEYTIVVDAVFGIGLSRPVAGTYREWIQKIREEKCKRKLLVISVDVPSGIHADTGAVLGIAVEADMTVTFGWEKTGLLLYPGAGYAGEVVTADIGIPPVISGSGVEANGSAAEEDVLQGEDPSAAGNGVLQGKNLSAAKRSIARKVSFLTAGTVRRLERTDILALPKRKPDTHKGDYGKVAVIAGSQGMCGAAILAAKAAYRAGAGIVTAVSAEENRIPIQTALPEAIFAPRSLAEEMIARADCLAVGPGLGTDEEAESLVRLALTSGKPVVADADALNCIGKRNMFALLHEQVIVTPHVGEMARMTGLSYAEIRENPGKTARDFAAKYGCICVLKGARTVVSGGKNLNYINTSGNAGMAVGGSGDVLTGIIAGLLATERDAKTAAPLGVYVHGLAGDEARDKIGERSMTAADILDGIIPVLRDRQRISG